MKDKIRKSEFKFLNYLFENMYSVKSKFYPDSTFFKKDDKVILELEKSGTLWVLYSVWTDISDMFSYGYEETQQLIKEWVEAQLKKGVVEPSRASSMYGLRIAIVEEKLKSSKVVPLGLLNGGFTQVEKQLNSEEITPLDAGINYLPFMEKQLKSEEVTLSVGQLYVSDLMEEQLKQEEITPFMEEELAWVKVEEQLKSEEITPQESIPTQIWRDLEKEEIMPRYAIAPPFRWRKLDSVKYVEINPNVPLSTYHLKAVEEQLKSEEITPTISTSYRLEQRLKSKEMTRCQVVNGSFEWIQEQINLGEEQLKSEEVTPRIVVPGSFDWIHKQIILEEMIPTSFFVKKKF